MSHQHRWQVLPVLLLLIVLAFNTGTVIVSARPADLHLRDEMTTPTLSTTATRTPTPGIQIGTEPVAWLDGSIDIEQFGPRETLTIHFNTAMSPESSPNPVLSWPQIDGVSSWDSTLTVLTFTPPSALDGEKTYTFFLDPSLRSAAGDALENPAEWMVHVQSGPKVRGVSPKPGSLEQRYRTIEVQFDQQMQRSISESMLLIEPRLPFELKWNSADTLQVILQQPLEPGQPSVARALAGVPPWKPSSTWS